MISIVSSKDNLLLLFDQKLFFSAATAYIPLLSFVADLLSFSWESANLFYLPYCWNLFVLFYFWRF